MMSLYPTAVDLDHALSRFGPVSAAPVSDAEHQTRIVALQERIRQAGLAAVWLDASSSLTYITGLQLGSLIAFAIITETVFQWPGMGFLFIQAVQFADVPVMAAYLCLIALIFVVVNLVVDLLYFAVDPRLRLEQPGGGH